MGPLIVIGVISFGVWKLCSSDKQTTTKTVYNKTTNNRLQISKQPSTYNSIPSHELERLRNEFNFMKTTEQFKKWKKEQYACQYGKCAWCKDYIDLYSPYTQIDHIKPLCKGGKNEYDNFVITCKSCNYYCKKGKYTWRDHHNTVHSGWYRPVWIRYNPLNEEKPTQNNHKINNTTAIDLSEIPF